MVDFPWGFFPLPPLRTVGVPLWLSHGKKPWPHRNRWFTELKNGGLPIKNGDFLYGYVSHNRFTELKNGGSFYMANCECHNRFTLLNSMVDLYMANCECHNQRLLYPSLVDSQAPSASPHWAPGGSRLPSDPPRLLCAGRAPLLLARHVAP